MEGGAGGERCGAARVRGAAPCPRRVRVRTSGWTWSKTWSDPFLLARNFWISVNASGITGVVLSYTIES